MVVLYLLLDVKILMLNNKTKFKKKLKQTTYSV